MNLDFSEKSKLRANERPGDALRINKINSDNERMNDVLMKISKRRPEKLRFLSKLFEFEFCVAESSEKKLRSVEI